MASQKKGRRSLSLESKIKGRLATVGVVNTSNRTLASVELRRQYGPKLASLIESGNKHALALMEQINKRRAYRANGVTNPTILESVEAPIKKLSKMIGIPVSEDTSDILTMMKLAASNNSYSSQKQFKSNLSEGLLLNVTTMASNALSIPAGQYVVWATDANSTMLVPTMEAMGRQRDVVTDRPSRQEVMTHDLVGCWNKVERVIGEGDRNEPGSNYENPAGGSERTGRPALKRKVDAAGGVRATAEKTGLSPGDVSKHVNNREFEISGDSARAYMDGVGAEPDDLYKYGEIKVWDYSSSGSGEEKEEEYEKSPPQARQKKLGNKAREQNLANRK